MGKENTTRYILLGFLYHEDMSGYDLKKRMDLSISHFWNASFGQIYPALRELLIEGLVEQRECASEKGPSRLVYSITEQGKQALSGWLEAPEDKEYFRSELLLKLFFSAGVSKGHSLARVEAFRARQETNLFLMQQFTAELEPILEDSPDHRQYYLTALFGKYVYQAYVDWAKEAARLLKA